MTRRVLAGTLVALVAAAGWELGTEDAAACTDASLRPERSNLPRVEKAMVCLLNRARVRRKLAPLRVAGRLERSAAAHTEDMTTRGYFAHHAVGRPTLYQRIRRTGYFRGAYTSLYSENLGYGPPEYASALGMHRAFMSSAGHRVNMLFARFRAVGIGSKAIDPHPAFYADYPAVVYTIDFGRRYVRRDRRCRRTARTAADDASAAARRRATRPRRYCRPRRR